jgi:hypothetical protein
MHRHIYIETASLLARQDITVAINLRPGFNSLAAYHENILHKDSNYGFLR